MIKPIARLIALIKKEVIACGKKRSNIHIKLIFIQLNDIVPVKSIGERCIVGSRYGAKGFCHCNGVNQKESGTQYNKMPPIIVTVFH
jgi:hypothetical protein